MNTSWRLGCSTHLQNQDQLMHVKSQIVLDVIGPTFLGISNNHTSILITSTSITCVLCNHLHQINIFTYNFSRPILLISHFFNKINIWPVLQKYLSSLFTMIFAIVWRNVWKSCWTSSTLFNQRCDPRLIEILHVCLSLCSIYVRHKVQSCCTW